MKSFQPRSGAKVASAQRESNMIITQIGATAAIIGFAIAVFASFYLDTSGTYGAPERETRMNIVDRTVVGGFSMFFVGILVGLIGLIWGI